MFPITRSRKYKAFVFCNRERRLTKISVIPHKGLIPMIILLVEFFRQGRSGQVPSLPRIILRCVNVHASKLRVKELVISKTGVRTDLKITSEGFLQEQELYGR